VQVASTNTWNKLPHRLKQQLMSEDAIRQRIAQDIATEIRRLVDLLETLTVDQETRVEDHLPQIVEAQVVPQQQVEAQVASQQTEANQEIGLGDRVRIVNLYGGRRGQTGEVVRVTRHQVVIRLDISQAVVTKGKSSVVVIHNWDSKQL